MKKLTLLILAAAPLLLTACLKENNNCCDVYYDPYFVAERNGTNVIAAPGSAKVGTDTISIFGVSNQAGVRMRFKFNGKGIYQLSGNQSKYYQVIGSDTVSRYNLGVAAGSSVEVTAYDSTNRIIGGKFTLNMKRTFPVTSSVYPDSVKFTKGQFVIALPR
ncbi:DUF6252 family protein [Mucilaginibacter glaciei]|uniref:Lipoprotein n=1 Tax=Mucilaginibacter glaciei TaxID=2772109 RepID=A0A926NPS8_9SPHI|nr:DUF6252 family protein [Mucilaginibacter glaciei]MBD1392837.1 hypothetical protein [Mucilaginibacter glaciei]